MARNARADFGRRGATGWLSWLRGTVLFVLSVVCSACASNYRVDSTPQEFLPARVVLRQLWSRTLTEQPLLDYKPQEMASPVIGLDGVVYVGAKSGRFVALDRRGQLRWQVRLGGGISSRPLIDAAHQTVFVGVDDGKMYALDTRNGAVRWSYPTQGTISPAPVYSEGLLLFTSSEDRVYCLDARNGKWRWQYERERPEGFTIHGYAGVLLHDGFAFTGFSDGVLVALKPATGEVVWTRSLGEGAERFFDADATPVALGPLVVAASYAGGVFALSPDSGSVVWRVPVESVLDLAADPSSGVVVATAQKTGVMALDRAGRQLWRQTVPLGVPRGPRIVGGRYLFVSSSETGLYVADLQSGELLQHFAPGRGISSAAGIGQGLLAVLSNYGRLYAFDLDP